MLPYDFLEAIAAVAMSALRLERPPQNILAVGAEVFDLQFSSQDLLREPRLVEIQRAGRSGVCCCHVNEKFWLYLQSLKNKDIFPCLTGWG